jgi:hypothetical protein
MVAVITSHGHVVTEAGADAARHTTSVALRKKKNCKCAMVPSRERSFCVTDVFGVSAQTQSRDVIGTK